MKAAKPSFALEARAALLQQVSFFAAIDPETLADVAARAKSRKFAAGQRMISELEFGSDLFVMVEGEAEISVEPRLGEKQILGRLGPAGTFGEMASLTGELRSATVTARTPVEALVISDREFDRLRARRPEIAVSLVRTLSQRIADAERSLELLLAGVTEKPAITAAKAKLGSLRMLWRELVVNRQKDLGFLTLAAFVCTLVSIRALVFASFRYDLAPRDVLRAAYVSGFALVIGSGCAALLTFRPAVRRAIAVAFGVGAALILNELGVTLAFDIFYKDIHTPDPTLAFDVERLYRRTEPIRAIVIGLSVLIQGVYLRRFYVRAWFVLATSIRRMWR